MKKTILPQVNPFSVIYDEEKDQYFRVNKITGDSSPSYKTGKLPPHFDPQITGSNYLDRKYKNFQNRENFTSSIFEKSSLKMKKNPLQKNFKLIIKENGIVNDQSMPSLKRNYEKTSNKSKQNQNISNRSSFYIRQSAKMSIERDRQQLSQSGMKMEKFENQLKKLNELQIKKQENSNKILRNELQKSICFNKTSFSSANESYVSLTTFSNKLNQNSIINKEAIQKNLQTLIAQQKSMVDLVKKKSKKIKQRCQNRSLQRNGNSNYGYHQALQKSFEKASKQKQIFLKFHPEHIFKENDRLIKEQEDRKLNFKNLQKLFISINDKETSRIYMPHEQHEHVQ